MANLANYALSVSTPGPCLGLQLVSAGEAGPGHGGAQLHLSQAGQGGPGYLRVQSQAARNGLRGPVTQIVNLLE